MTTSRYTYSYVLKNDVTWPILNDVVVIRLIFQRRLKTSRALYDYFFENVQGMLYVVS